MGEKKKKIKPYTEQWERLAGQVARQHVKTIYPCADCGHPVVRGYCCTGCHSRNPGVCDE